MHEELFKKIKSGISPDPYEDINDVEDDEGHDFANNVYFTNKDNTHVIPSLLAEASIKIQNIELNEIK